MPLRFQVEATVATIMEALSHLKLYLMEMVLSVLIMTIEVQRKLHQEVRKLGLSMEFHQMEVMLTLTLFSP